MATTRRSTSLFRFYRDVINPEFPRAQHIALESQLVEFFGRGNGVLEVVQL
jgi:hypothetical protein